MSTEPDRSSHKPNLDATKGILICLIVLGHNYFFSRFYAEWFSFLYNFHVASFLLFPFLFHYGNMNPATYGERTFRSLVPQAFFLALVVPIYYLMFIAGVPDESAKWLSRIPLALALQTETQLDMVTGFRHFWFLPAMTLLLSLLWLYDRHGVALRGTLIVLLTLWHFLIGEADTESYQYYPWGAAIVGFIFLPGLIVRNIELRGKSHWERAPVVKDLLLFSVWLLLSWVVMKYHFFMPLAGDPAGIISGFAQPVRLLAQDLFLIVSFITVLRLAWWLRASVLVPVGRESLKIFLLSPLVWQLFWRSGGQTLDAETSEQRGLLVVSTFILTVAVSYFLSRLISATFLQSVIFPRRLSDWRRVFK